MVDENGEIQDAYSISIKKLSLLEVQNISNIANKFKVKISNINIGKFVVKNMLHDIIKSNYYIWKSVVKKLKYKGES